MSKEFHGIVKAWGTTFRKAQTVKKKKRAGSIFAIMSVAHVDDDVEGGGEVYHVEEVFPNGDMYTGQWSNSCPNGHGKYLWADGCMYVGEWIKGKSNGKGKFCWPCGATYEGQFKKGYMHGEGTFTSSSNNTYRGSWAMNMKHGRGIKNYANGDHYEGGWRRGWPDGQGRYQWSNGNQYIGQWRNGKMKGNGTMIWGNGNRYDGCWEDGLPKGNGRYQWADGSFYAGIWNHDPKEMTGTYYDLNSSNINNSDQWDPQEVYFNDLSDSVISVSEKIPIFPSEKVVNWPCCEEEEAEKEKDLLQKNKNTTITNNNPKTNGGRLSSSSDCSETTTYNLGSFKVDRQGSFKSQKQSYYDQDSIINGGGIKHHHHHHHLIKIQPTKRQGQKIMKGHKNYDLMLNLQLGIRHSVGRPAISQSLDLRAAAFDTKEKIWTKFPPEGSKHTPPHQSSDFKWKDYCPLVFRTLRKLFKVDPADYMLSICGNDALRELSSPGKSGSFFYLTNDDKYMIKTMKKSEVKVLLRMLPAYYNHVRAFDNTLITKFYGLHCVKVTGASQKKVRFVIMGNLFCIDHAIHRRFDLKGSSLGRLTDKNESEIDSTTTLKDLDLNFIFRLQKVWFQEFCRQVDKDCDFLEQERIMDYSLLLGIHFRQVSETGEPIAVEPPSSSSSSSASSSSEVRTSDGEGGGGTPPRLSRADDMDILFDPSAWAASIRLGINVPARAEVTVRRNDELELIGEPTGEFYDVILVFGIIDILQDYDISKKLEHAYKSIQYDPTSISAVDPRQYSKRFRDFLFRAFTEEDS